MTLGPVALVVLLLAWSSANEVARSKARGQGRDGRGFAVHNAKPVKATPPARS